MHMAYVPPAVGNLSNPNHLHGPHAHNQTSSWPIETLGLRQAARMEYIHSGSRRVIQLIAIIIVYSTELYNRSAIGRRM